MDIKVVRDSGRKGSSEAQQKFYNKQFSRITIGAFKQKIAPEDLLYFGGSCFAENLYTYWQDHFLPSALSPFGSTYNPLSLKDSFTLLCDEREVTENELFYHNNLWSHSLFNTTLSRPDKEELLSVINMEICRHRELIKESAVLVLTLGTAFVFEEISSGRIVNNCHRRPSSDFKRYVLSPEDVAAALRELNSSVRDMNPSVKIILSLSPVRHLRDNAAENSLSKAVLRCGIEDYLKGCKTEEAPSFYFPSYEILLDELRDYRWYADDLSHPSQAAISYIMERFCETAADKTLISYMEEAESLKNLMEHKLRFPESSEGMRFIKKKEQKLKEFRKKYPMSLLPV
jgi:GSCFA family